MRNLTASRATGASDDVGSTDSAAIDASEASAAEALAKPLIELRAGLGELALFVSGRVCDDWWPSQVGYLHVGV